MDPSETLQDPRRNEEQARFVWANQQNHLAMDYHNRAALILQKYMDAGRPKNWQEYGIDRAEYYAQMSLYYSFNPRGASGTLYNLARAQAIQNKVSEVQITFRIFRDNMMPKHLREGIINGEPDFENVEDLEELKELKQLYAQINETGLAGFHRQVEFGLVQGKAFVDEVRVPRKGDSEPVHFRFQNPTKLRLDNLKFDIRFLRPLGLSGSKSALMLFQHTIHGRVESDKYYLISYIMSIGAQEIYQTGVELNIADPETNEFAIEIEYSPPDDSEIQKKTFKVLTPE